MEQEQHGSCRAVVTTSRKPHVASEALARQTAAQLSLPYVLRGTLSAEELRARYGVSCLLVARQGGLRLETPEGELFFHPNMSHLRVKNLRYYKSQPWGNVQDILAGFYCDVDGSADIRLARDELREAVWVPRADVVGQTDDFSLTHEMMMTFRAGNEPK